MTTSVSNSTIINDFNVTSLKTWSPDSENSGAQFDSEISPRFLTDLFQFDWNFFDGDEYEEEEVTKRPKKKKKKKKKSNQKKKKRNKSRYFMFLKTQDFVLSWLLFV
jgi:hypothetical protein